LVESVGNFLPLASEKGVRLTLKCPEGLPKVLVDKFRISEVLSNLIGNAIAYTKPRGEIEVASELAGGEVVTHVKDTGQGIPEAALPKLFTKFFRVSGILEQGSKGTGLGLYIAKAIVGMHQGKIWVASKMGVGSTFSFTVPTVESEIKRSLPEKAESPILVGQPVGGKDTPLPSPVSKDEGAVSSLGPKVENTSGPPNNLENETKKPKRFFRKNSSIKSKA